MSTDQPYDEKELLRRISQDDESAFGQLIRYYAPLIYRQLVTVLRDPQQAEELGQDIFMIIWRNRSRLADMESFGGYLHVIARNMAYKALKAMIETTPVPPPDTFQVLLDGPAASLEVKELRKVLEKGISLLPERRRLVFTLSRTSQLTYEEIASELNISRSAVKQHIIAAMVFLRTYLRQHGELMVLLLWWLAETLERS